MIQPGDRRVHYCEQAGREVVQEAMWAKPTLKNVAGSRWEIVPGDIEWLCLHNDTEEEDARDVERFKQQQV